MTNPFFQNLRDDLKACEHARRGTGRTTAMIDSMDDGDVLVTHTVAAANDLRRVAKERGKTIIILGAHDERDLHHQLQNVRGNQCKIHLDHYLLEVILRRKIADFEKMVDIIHIQNHPFTQEKKP